jgi:hypothetical protein
MDIKDTYVPEKGEHAVKTVLYIIDKYYPDLKLSDNSKNCVSGGAPWDRYYPFENKQGEQMFVVENHTNNRHKPDYRFPGQITPHVHGWVGTEEYNKHRWSGMNGGISQPWQSYRASHDYYYDSRGKKVEDLMKQIDKAVPTNKKLIK